jgi:hypothetical protein
MEIYILRDGKEIGPFSEETTQTMLKEGSIVINDLAWQPGMPQWITLHSVLYPPVGASVGAVRPPPPPPGFFAAPPPSASGTPGADGNGASSFPLTVPEPESRSALVQETPPAVSEPATAKQKAFLSFAGIPFPADITRERAALLVNDALENPADPGRLSRWNEERLRLHPELFRAEIQAKKENRASHFFDVVHMQGGEMFDGVTKAHCQVLVGFLDVRYPNWDANEQQATWDYFFPAIAEKFPQLVKREWKGKLKYPAGPKVAPELARRTGFQKPVQRAWPIGAVVRGIITGAAILVLIYFGYNYWQNGKDARDSRASAAKPGDSAEQSAAGNGSLKSPDASRDNATAGLEKLLSQMPPAAAPTIGDGSAANGASASPTTANGTGTMPATSGETGSAPAGNGSPPPLFDPNATTATTPLPANPPSDVGTAAQPRTTLIITKPTEVALKFGRVTLPAGSVVRFVSQEGTLVRIRYGTEVVAIPAASTDWNDLPPAPPAVPGPVPPTPAPLAPTPVAPAPATPPAATPPTSPTSLF